MFEEILAKYRISYIGEGNMPTTADQVIEKLNRILTRLSHGYGVRVENGRIVGLNAVVLSDWYDGMTASGLKITTRNNYVVLLNPFLSWGCTRRIIEKDPLDEAPIYKILTVKRLPKEDEIPESERKEKSFTPEQVKMLMLSITGGNAARDRAILALFLASGLRVSELCSLTLGSILEEKRGVIYVKRKGGSWKHTEVADFFYKYIEEYLKTRDLSDLSKPLFLTSRNTPCSRKQVWKALAAREKSVGLASGVHMLRHTTLSNIEKNASASAARDLANHSSFAMTNKYTHTSHEERLAAINSLDWGDL